MQTMVFSLPVWKPAVLSTSTTAEPDQMVPSLSGRMAF
jgi:hypothetical protein